MKHSSKPLAHDAVGEQIGEEWASQARPLRECGEIAATRLSAVFSNALKQAADQLFAMGARGAASHEQRLWLDAADFARSRRQDIVDAFRKHFQHRYGLACRRKSAFATSHVLDFDIGQLKIIEHDVLDNTLDPADLIDAIRNSTWSALHDLTRWFRDVRDEPDLIPNEMPLGPKLIGNAVADAINDQFWGHDAKLRLIRALGRSLPEPINRIYLDLTVHLARTGKSEQPLEELEARFAVPPMAPSPLVETDAATPDGAPAVPSSETTVMATTAKTETELVAASLAAADQATAKWLADTRLPEFIHAFLAGPWHKLLVRIHHDHGSSGPDWEAALATLEDLVRSLRPPTNAGERARLMRDLPDLVRRLTLGLEAQDALPAAREPFLAQLADYHIKLLSIPRAAPDTPPVYMTADIPLESLEVGIWLEVIEADGLSRELKLAWISPHRKLFLLTDQQGLRALSLNAKDLAARLRDGKARLLPAQDGARADKGVSQSSDNKKTA